MSENEQKPDKSATEPSKRFMDVEPRPWELLLTEYYHLLSDKSPASSARRGEIVKQLLDKHEAYKKANPQFFGRRGRSRDDERER